MGPHRRIVPVKERIMQHAGYCQQILFTAICDKGNLNMPGGQSDATLNNFYDGKMMSTSAQVSALIFGCTVALVQHFVSYAQLHPPSYVEDLWTSCCEVPLGWSP